MQNLSSSLIKRERSYEQKQKLALNHYHLIKILPY